MATRYNENFKIEVVKAYMAGDRSISEIAADYNVAKSTLTGWVKKHGEECQYKTTTKTSQEEFESAKEIRRLNQLLHEKDKEIDFLKKAAAFFAKEIDQWYIDSLTKIRSNLAQDGCADILRLALIVTTII